MPQQRDYFADAVAVTVYTILSDAIDAGGGPLALYPDPRETYVEEDFELFEGREWPLAGPAVIAEAAAYMQFRDQYRMMDDRGLYEFVTGDEFALRYPNLQIYLARTVG